MQKNFFYIIFSIQKYNLQFIFIKMASESGQFSAAPKVVKPKKKYKQKEPEEQQQDEIKLIYNNLMWDKRVVRGNTYSALVTTSKNVQIPYANSSKQKQQIAPIPQSDELQDIGSKRANIQIFTDEHVETLTDKPPRYQYGAQTQFKIDKPVIRHRMPVKIGVDRQTQIQDDQLFDFDYEVQPLLSVLCARTLEISRMEVLQEEELSIMKLRQMELQLAAKQDEVTKVNQMYRKEEELEKQNAKRLENYRKQKQKKIQSHQRLFSRVLGKNYLRDLRNNTLNYVEGQGYFRKEIDNQLVEKLLPSLYNQSIEQQQADNKWKQQAQQLLNAAMEVALKQHKWSKQVQKTRREQILAKRAELAREKVERKRMKEEDKYMKNFLIQQKAYLQKLEQERKKAQQAENNGQQPPAS